VRDIDLKSAVADKLEEQESKKIGSKAATSRFA
jgi:hypothetical protein